MFTIKFLKVPKKFKACIDDKKAYSLNEASQAYLEAVTTYPELAFKKLKLELTDAESDQMYEIDTSIHVNSSLQAVVMSKMNATEEDKEMQLLKSRLEAAFNAETKPIDGVITKTNEIPQVLDEDVIEQPISEPDVRSLFFEENEANTSGLGVEDLLSGNQVTSDFDIANILETGSSTDPHTESLAHIFGLEEGEVDDDPVTTATSAYEEPPRQIQPLEVALPPVENFLNPRDFKAIKKLEALKADIKLKMNEADPILVTDLELLQYEIEDCIKDISNQVKEGLEGQLALHIEAARAEVESFKENVETQLDDKFQFLENDALTGEMVRNFELQKQSLQEKYETELEALETEQERMHSESLATHQKNINVDYQRELFDLCEGKFRQTENQTVENLTYDKNKFDLELFKKTAPQIDVLLEKRKEIINQIEVNKVPTLNREPSHLPAGIVPMPTVSNHEHLTSLTSSLETKLDEEKELNRKSNVKIAELEMKTKALELKLENNTTLPDPVVVGRTGIGLKVLLGVSLIATLFIGWFAYTHINSMRDLNHQLIDQNHFLESQLASHTYNPMSLGALTFSEYVSNGDYLLAARHHPEQASALVRHLFEREDVANLRMILATVSDIFGWLNVAILEADHDAIIREFENLLPAEQQQLSIRQQTAVDAAYEAILAVVEVEEDVEVYADAETEDFEDHEDDEAGDDDYDG